MERKEVSKVRGVSGCEGQKALNVVALIRREAQAVQRRDASEFDFEKQCQKAVELVRGPIWKRRER